ncbi:MAG: acetylxylan esterase, partial [Limisphaerales bacterium]
MIDAEAQPSDANYDEAKVGDYHLPDPLVLENGEAVRDAKTWKEKRRPELVRLFETHVYGKSPGKPENIFFKKTSEDKHALGGR